MSDEAVWYTTPSCARPPGNAVNQAKRSIPEVLNVSDSDGSYHPAPPAPHKIVRPSTLIARLKEKGHARDAAQWAIHELIQEGLLTVGGAWKEKPGVFDLHDRRPIPPPVRYLPNDFKGAVPFDKIVVQTTDCLWQWWHDCPGQGGSLPQDIRPAANLGTAEGNPKTPGSGAAREPPTCPTEGRFTTGPPIDPTEGEWIQIASDVPDLGTAKNVSEFWEWCNRHR